MSNDIGSLGRMIEHLAWADEQVAQSLAAATTVPPRALSLLGHVVAAEHVWHARLTGATPTHPVWPDLSVDEAAALSRANVAGLRTLVDSMSLDDLHRGVAYTNSTGASFTTAAIDILIHVCLHGAYHRGQIAMSLRQAGGEPVNSDYVAYVRATAAAARQP